MKKWLQVGLLALAIASVTMLMGGRVAVGEVAPENYGTPLPASWDQYPWEVEHKVIQGEFLYMLAGFYYRDGRKWNWIWEYNRAKIGENPNRIKPGTILTIRVPRDWSPPMPYSKWYETMREEYMGYHGPGGHQPGLGNEEAGT